MPSLIIALLALGLILIILEVFVPGAVLGILGTVCLIAGVWLSFRAYGTEKGTWVFVVTTISVFVVTMIALKVLPRTRMGQKILLSEKVEGGPYDKTTEQERQRLLGREGMAETDLRPVGKGLIDGKRWDIVSDGSYIDKGKPFRVVRVEGPRIVVSPIAKPS